MPSFKGPPSFDSISPMTTSGDIIYGGTAGTGTRLAKGANGQFLTLAAGLPSWGAASTLPIIAARDANYPILTTDYVVPFTPTADRTTTLPTAVGVTGQPYIIVKVGGGSFTVQILTTSSQTISLRASGSVYLRRPGDYVKVVSDGANWVILDKQETQIIETTSTLRNNNASGATGEYQNIVGNSLALTYGEWEVEGWINLYSGGGTSQYLDSNSGFYAAAGDDTTSQPTQVTAGQVITGYALMGNFYNTIASGVVTTVDYGFIAHVRMTMSLTGDQTIYLVPKITYTVAAGTNRVYARARRIW